MDSKTKEQILTELLNELKNGVNEEEVKKKYQSYFRDFEFSGLDSWTQSAQVKVPTLKNETTTRYEDQNPLVLFAQENGALKALIENIYIDLKNEDEVGRKMLIDEFLRLKQIRIHYQKKEAILFPFLEKCGVKTLSVVKQKDDEVLSLIEEINDLFKGHDPHQYKDKIHQVTSLIFDTIAYENHFLLPVLDERLKEDELTLIEMNSDLIGYCLIRYTK